jgi:hypothetical protein
MKVESRESKEGRGVEVEGSNYLCHKKLLTKPERGSLATPPPSGDPDTYCHMVAVGVRILRVIDHETLKGTNNEKGNVVTTSTTSSFG